MTEEKRFSGKVAVITGGASGIGKATATALAERGANVVIGDLSQEKGEAAVQEINENVGKNVAVFEQTNVSKYKDNIALFQRAEKEFGGVDIVFLNAGTGRGWDSVFDDLDDETEESVFMTNVLGVVKGTKVALLHLAKRGGGVIVTTSSIGGFHSNISAAAYCASKHAVIGWTRSFNEMQKVANIRVNAVCPGYVDVTNFMSSAYDEGETNKTLIYDINPITPTVKIETVVKTVLTFIQDESLNGETWYALPGDVIRPQARIDYPVECTSPEYLKAAAKMEEDYVVYHQKLLQKAQERYEKKLSQLE